MNDFIIETHDLNYHYGSQRVLKDINLKVPAGCIYAFLGPNGSGKTTTIRLLLGLLRQGGDDIRLFGISLKKGRIAILKQTGSLVEEPSFYGHLNGRENLTIIARLRGVPLNRVTEVLRILQLQKDAGHKVKNFSIGMKQRLALAMALLSEPALLVLDEPTNGLDPQGIADTREFLLSINKETGVTIFLSSHLLSEVEKLAGMMGVLSRGQMLFQGSIQELGSLKSNQAALNIETNDLIKTSQILAPVCKIMKTDQRSIQIAYHSQAQVAELVRLLVAHHLDIYRIVPEQYSLEKFFLSLTHFKKEDS